MKLTELSNYQLYSLIQNNKLDASIREPANTEFENRKLTVDQIKEIVKQHDLLFKPDNDEGLSSYNKAFLIFVPAFFTIQVLIAGRYLANNERKKWKDFWLYVSLGYVLWTVAIITLAKLNRK
ncbi:hypothetical protein [Pinibacter aurantiacus]|uniref:Uncharacterized protein n=1 Tax=Pinibacter aurantiacus TaxID=2851599 RepID=A0A9E2SFA4_9BACT|nr:hypothetical protein [Pinibacter aurantiacus]MBV4360343.1 hypothetical protein [Pinibacter aurantiacus]